MAETLVSAAKGAPEALAITGHKSGWMGRAEIDTSAPFESVKEAVTRFGGSAPWKPQPKQQIPFEPERNCLEEADIILMEEQTAQLERDLIVKERETLDVLKELEMTKMIVDGLKLQLQQEDSERLQSCSQGTNVYPNEQTEGQSTRDVEKHLNFLGPNLGSKMSPGLILMELKQAKVNLNRTTSDLIDIRASVESLHTKVEDEKKSLEKTRERLTLNTAKISCLEEELKKTRLKLQLTKYVEMNGDDNHLNISKKMQQLSSETEEFKMMAEAAKSDVSKMKSEIKHTKDSIKTAEIRWLAAKKMEEAAKAAEAMALAEIHALTNNFNSTRVGEKNPLEVTLFVEEYDTLACKAQEASELYIRRIEAAMVNVDEANRSKLELLNKVEEATAEVQTSRYALEEALKRVEAANRGKLAVEEALRKWRSEHGHGQKRRSIHNSTKFKNSHASHHRRDSRLLDVNGQSLSTDGLKSGSRSMMSIGQILSRKLMEPEVLEVGTRQSSRGKPKISLAQMLSKRHLVLSPQRTEDGIARKQASAKLKKFGLVGFSLTVAKQNKSKKKKRQSCSSK